MARNPLPDAARIVVKVGSSSLASPDGGLEIARLDALVGVLADTIAAGHEVILVSSGAIAAGIAPLGLGQRPGDVATQQAAAGVGQGALIAAYQQAFAARGLVAAQLLLTGEDVIARARYKNAQRALERLLELQAVPIINENDTVATDEIRFGDNDRLAALVAHLCTADALLLLSDVDALYDRPPSDPAAERLAVVSTPEELADISIAGTGSSVGTGGMATKVQAAQMATATGIPAIVTAASLAGPALTGRDVGTLFTPTHARRSARLLWMAYAARPTGSLTLDDGAVRAVTLRGTNLFPAGVTAVHGSFDAGEPVELRDLSGNVVARGLVNYAAAEIPELLGRSTAELAATLGPEYEHELVHRSSLVVLEHVGSTV